MDFRFKEGFRPRRVAAAVVAAELERIKEQESELTAEAVFEAARPAAATLHPEFEWSGPRAIRELGLIRARNLIRAVVVVPPEPERHPHRVWVHVADDGSRSGSGTYQHATTIVTTPDLFERAISELQRRFDGAAEALNELNALAQQQPDADRSRLAAIGLAVQGFGAVREALAILK